LSVTPLLWPDHHRLYILLFITYVHAACTFVSTLMANMFPVGRTGTRVKRKRKKKKTFLNIRGSHIKKDTHTYKVLLLYKFRKQINKLLTLSALCCCV
jgi:hypothetical protein